MSGNVYEWTSTLYVAKPPYIHDGNHENTNNSINRRVLRGGSWYRGAGYARVAFRSYLVVGYSSSGVGMRVARGGVAG